MMLSKYYRENTVELNKRKYNLFSTEKLQWLKQVTDSNHIFLDCFRDRGFDKKWDRT